MVESRWSLALALTSAAALWACQSTPPGAVQPKDPGEGIQPPPAWSQSGGAAPLSLNYWEALNSPTLEGLIQEGLAANPSLAAMGLRVEQAAAYLDATIGQQSPAVSASLSAARRRVNYVGLPVPGSSGVLSSTSSQLSLGVDVVWELDLWGRLASAERGAVADVEALGYDAAAARISLAGQIAKAAMTLVEGDESTRLATEALALAEQIQANERRLLSGGSGRAESVLAADARVQSAKAILAGAQRASAAAVNRMASLLGRPAGTLKPATRAALRTELLAASLPPAPDAGVPADVLHRRPDLAAAEARIRSAQAGAEVARAQLYPSLSLMASAGTSGSELKNLVDGDFRVWSLGANVLAPLFNSGRLRALEDQAITARDIALVEFAQVFLQACAEVDGALTNELYLLQEIEQQGAYLAQLQATAAFIERKQQRGSASSSEVLAARDNALFAQTQILAVQRALYHNRIDLYLALGGGFELNTSEQE